MRLSDRDGHSRAWQPRCTKPSTEIQADVSSKASADLSRAVYLESTHARGDGCSRSEGWGKKRVRRGGGSYERTHWMASEVVATVQNIGGVDSVMICKVWVE